MAKLLPLHSGAGQLVIGQRPCTAPSTTPSSTRRHTGGGSRQPWTQADKVRPVTSYPGQWLILEEVEPLIHSRLTSIKSALMAVDPDGTGLVSKEEFRLVLKSLLPVSQSLLDTLLNEVCERSTATVDYMQFLRRFGRAPVAQRACNSSVRRVPQKTSKSLSEIQKHLKDKIGGNLRTVIRVFHLFDYNQDGHIQQHEFRRILDNYCIHLTDKEFQRLWNHYSPSNTATISYELFLDKLGFGDSHNFKIAPVCTKLEVSSRVTTPCDRVKQRKQRAGSLSNSCNAPSVLPHRKLQTLFYDKMCMNSTPVWQALQAFDTAHSGLVKQDVLRAVLSSFIFPMNPHSFQKLTSRYGVRATGPVRWKHFLSHFMSPGKEDGNTNLQLDRVSKQPAPDEDNLDFQEIYPRLKEIFHLLDTKEAGGITRADLRHLLERPGGTQPRLQRSQITELFNVLDPEHTGVIQLASLERFDPSITSAPTGNTAPPPSPPNTAEPLDIPKETEDTTTEMEEQKTPDERQTTQWADKVSVASASWRTVKSLLQDKLCEQLSSVLADLKLCDPQHTGHVTQEDLKKVLSCYGMPISDTHFNKLCEPFSSRPGTSSTLVSYNCFIRNLGVPLQKATNTSSPHKERPFTSPQSPLQSVEGQRPPSSLQDCPDTCSILDTVFQRMRLRLEQHQTSLTDRIQAIIHSSEETLSETDVRKILEDSWIVLDNKTFKMFTELLGFMDGQIERSVFQAKYEEAVARDRQQGSEGGDGDRVEVDTLPTSAEQCLAAMKNRIKAIHGNNLTAFRLMDKKHKGVVDCHDFRTLYNSLGFFCREGEYERLLDLIGLHPGGNLNYAEFIDIVENNGKQWARATSVQEQLHELLACEAHCKWGDISKALCQFDADGQGWIHKKSLRGLLFTYALPISSNEFDQLWSRYDPEGQGCVAVCDFLEKLGFHHEGELKSLSQKLNQTVAQLDANRQVSTDAASLENIQLKAADGAGAKVGGTTKIIWLLIYFIQHQCDGPTDSGMAKIVHLLKVSMDDNCKRLSYMDFLSAFDSKAERKCEPPLASPDPVRQIESLDNLSPDVALARMRELVTATAPNLYKAFSAFDQSGTGTVRALEFRQVLESFCAHPSDKQYRYILSKLELDCENCTVNWKDFLSKFQSQEPVVKEVQEDVTGHQKITKELMDLDTSNSTTISKEQFRQLCDRHCLSLTNDQFKCVWCQMPVSERRKLQHREVLQSFGALSRTTHIEAGGPINNIPSPSPEPRETTSRSKPCCPNAAGAILQRTKSASQCTPRRPASVGRPGTGSPLGSMERRLRGAVQHCWKEIQRNCAAQDPQQEGHISATSFLEILQSLNISMTQQQLEYLAVKFDFMSNGHVSYHNFLHHLLLNLKPAEAKRTFERCKLPLPNTPLSQGVLSKDCMEVMLRTLDVVRSSWTSIRRSFLTSDRTRSGRVSVQDFRKVLCHFSVNLSEEEFFHLSSYFDANTTGQICYNSFLWAFLH